MGHYGSDHNGSSAAGTLYCGTNGSNINSFSNDGVGQGTEVPSGAADRAILSAKPRCPFIVVGGVESTSYCTKFCKTAKSLLDQNIKNIAEV